MTIVKLYDEEDDVLLVATYSPKLTGIGLVLNNHDNELSHGAVDKKLMYEFCKSMIQLLESENQI